VPDPCDIINVGHIESVDICRLRKSCDDDIKLTSVAVIVQLLLLYIHSCGKAICILLLIRYCFSYCTRSSDIRAGGSYHQMR
jgi:hypothetical protein